MKSMKLKNRFVFAYILAMQAFVLLIIIGLCFYSCNDDEKQKKNIKP